MALYTAPTLQQLAVTGFYHPYDEDPYVVPCFSCRIEDNIGNGSESLMNEEVEEALLDWHAESCLWGDMRRDAAASS